MNDTQPTHSCGKPIILMAEHFCTTTATMELRFRTNPIMQMMEAWHGSQQKTLEQAHQCIHCGKVDWREVPTICEEGKEYDPCHAGE
jgi:hypothetical protein